MVTTIMYSSPLISLSVIYPTPIKTIVSIAVLLDGRVEALELDGSPRVLREKPFAVEEQRVAEVHHGEIGLNEVVEGVYEQHVHRAVYGLDERRLRGDRGGRRGRAPIVLLSFLHHDRPVRLWSCSYQCALVWCVGVGHDSCHRDWRIKHHHAGAGINPLTMQTKLEHHRARERGTGKHASRSRKKIRIRLLQAPHVDLNVGNAVVERGSTEIDKNTPKHAAGRQGYTTYLHQTMCLF